MADVDAAAQRVAAGGLVAFPTETVYGLGARADEQGGVPPAAPPLPRHTIGGSLTSEGR